MMMMGPKVQRYATIVRDRVSPDGQKKNRATRNKETMARKNRQNCMRVIERIEIDIPSIKIIDVVFGSYKHGITQTSISNKTLTVKLGRGE